MTLAVCYSNINELNWMKMIGLKWIVAFILSGLVLLYRGAWKLQRGPTASANSRVQEALRVCLQIKYKPKREDPI